MSRFFAGTETGSVLLRCHCGHRSRERERHDGNATLVVAEFVLALISIVFSVSAKHCTVDCGALYNQRVRCYCWGSAGSGTGKSTRATPRERDREEWREACT